MKHIHTIYAYKEREGGERESKNRVMMKRRSSKNSSNGGKSFFASLGSKSLRLNEAKTPFEANTAELYTSLAQTTGPATTMTTTRSLLSTIENDSLRESLRTSEKFVSTGANPTHLAKLRVPSVDTSTYTIKDRKGQWSRIGSSNVHAEKPITRKEILALERKFEAAIRYSKMTSLTDPSGRTNPTLEHDVVNMRREIQDLYRESSTIHVKEQKQLTEASIAQKWTDLVFDEIAGSIGVGCLENGRLLSKIRKHYGNAFEIVRNVQKKTLKDFQSSEKMVHKLRAELEQLQNILEKSESEFESRQRRALEDLRDRKNAELDEAKAQNDELLEQNDTLKHTLSTLNDIFKRMSLDSDALREANLREANNRMQGILTEQKARIESLSKIEDLYQTAKLEIAQQSADIEELKTQLDEKRIELEQQRALSQELLASQGEKLAKMETMMSKVESGGENLEETQKKLEKMARDSIRNDGRSGGAEDDNVLCVRCRKSMAESRRLDEFENTLGEKMKRLPCASFRILLPNLLGFEPERPKAWTLRCVRSMLVAKLKDDALCVRRGQMRTRMPEFVYTWFAPPSLLLDQENGFTKNKRSRDEAIAEADENRWALYV